MAVGDMSLCAGDCVRLTAKLSDIRFCQSPRYVFDLSKVLIKTKEDNQNEEQ
jgi:hypothetical protein